MKYLVVALLCLAVFTENLEGWSIKHGKDEVKQKFHELKEVIAKTHPQHKLQSLMEKFETESATIEKHAKPALEKVLSPLRKKLDALVDKAQAKGFDVKKCQKYLDAFMNTPDDLMLNLINCVNKQVDKARGYIEDALKHPKHIVEDLANASTLVSTLLPNLETCSVEQLKTAGVSAAENISQFGVCASVK